MFEGDLDHGELEIGQVSALITETTTAAEIVRKLVKEFNETLERLQHLELSPSRENRI